MLRHTLCSVGVGFLLASSVWSGQVSLRDFSATPAFTDDFSAGGTAAPRGDWAIDADLSAAIGAAVLDAPGFVSALPGGLDAAFAGNPVVNNPSGDSRVMLIGNDSADAGTHFGLAYVDLIDSVAGAGGDSFDVSDYRIEAWIYYLGTADTVGRFQGGIYGHAGVGQNDLFRMGVHHSAITVGAFGPGFGVRGVIGGTQDYPTPSPITNGRWTRMSLAVIGDDVATLVDANGDGVLDESDPLEYQSWARDAADINHGYPAIWTVGEISRDIKPLFVDDVRIYLLKDEPVARAYATPAIETVASSAEIQAHSGLSTTTLRGLGVDSGGRVLIYDRGASGVADGGLYRVDLSGPSPAFTTIATEAQIVAQAIDSITDIDCDGIVEGPNGMIYLASFAGNDDIFRINPTGPVVTNIHDGGSVTGIAIDPLGERLYYTEEMSFGGSDPEELRAINLVTLADTVVADETAIDAASGATDGAWTGVAANTDGDLLLPENDSFGGTGSVVLVTPSGGSVELVRNAAAFSGSFTSDHDAIATDGNSAVFTWNTPTGNDARISIIQPNGSIVEVLQPDIAAAIGKSSFFIASGGMAAYPGPYGGIPSGDVHLYAADTSNHGIVRLTFGASSDAAEWALYR